MTRRQLEALEALLAGSAVTYGAAFLLADAPIWTAAAALGSGLVASSLELRRASRRSSR